MTLKIILADLEKELFPEIYPYHHNYFYLEKLLVKGEQELSELTIKNIRFKLKTVGYCLLVEDSDVRKSLYLLFQKHVALFFDWRKEYDWYELISVLYFFLITSEIKTYSELEELIAKSHFKDLVGKYFTKFL